MFCWQLVSHSRQIMNLIETTGWDSEQSHCGMHGCLVNLNVTNVQLPAMLKQLVRKTMSIFFHLLDWNGANFAERKCTFHSMRTLSSENINSTLPCQGSIMNSVYMTQYKAYNKLNGEGVRYTWCYKYGRNLSHNLTIRSLKWPMTSAIGFSLSLWNIHRLDGWTDR